MGRLNYTNRKIDGVKLGQVVAKDLTKRIPPALGSKAALRDPVIEIDLRSKQLTDAGFIELSEGLTKALYHNGPQGNIVLLEELCLKANKLTVASLERLTPIINLVANDLRDLDLSDNLISVNDPYDVIAWEGFLVSLSQCCVLRRLDLSGNDLGTEGFEVLTRVYAREEPIDIDLSEEFECLGISTVAHCVVSHEHVNVNSTRVSTPESDDINGAEESRLKQRPRREKQPRNGPKALEKGNHSSPEKHDHSVDHLEHLRIYSATKGLHSIPYIVLADSCMNDAGALYLSYIIVEHQGPSQLLKRVPAAKPGPEQQQLDIYNETQCRGIIYTSNMKMTKKGIKVLNLAEEERRRLTERTSSNESNDTLGSLVTASELPEHSRAMSMLSDHLKANKHRRRTSGSTNGYVGSSGAPAKPMSDLDRARSRIQGDELEKTGQYGNDLWRLAIVMLCICREIQYPRPKEIQRAVQQHYRPNVDLSLGEDFSILPPVIPPKLRRPIVKTLDVPGYPMSNAKVAAPLLPLGNGNPNQALSSRSHYSRKSSLPEITNGSTLPSTIPELMSSETRCRDAIACLKAKEYRSRLPCGFSEDIWWKILGQAAGAHGILSQRQQRSVLSWAMDRNTLKREREWLVEKEGNQIWHVLDGMTCLAYEYDA